MAQGNEGALWQRTWKLWCSLANHHKWPLKKIEIEFLSWFISNRRLAVQTACSSLNHQPEEQHQFHHDERQAEELMIGCEPDSIVVDRLSPLTPPSSIKKLMGPHLNNFTTGLLPVKIGSLNKLVHLNKPGQYIDAQLLTLATAITSVYYFLSLLKKYIHQCLSFATQLVICCAFTR